MDLDIYQQYLIVNRLPTCKAKSIITKLADIKGLINKTTFKLEAINTYEIYTCCPDTGVGGWEIKNVTSTDSMINGFPLFDEIISKNDCHGDIDWLDFDKYINR